MLNVTTEARHVSHLERKNFFVDSEEEGHSSGPGCQPSHITTNFLGIFHGVVLHLEVRHQQLHSFFVDGILSVKMRYSTNPQVRNCYQKFAILLPKNQAGYYMLVTVKL